jgi:hypothetical protein
MLALAGAALVAALGACSSAPRGACNPHPARGEVGSICGFHDPEDVEALPSRGLLLVSQMAHESGAAGSIAALVLDGGTEPRVLWPETAAIERRGARVDGWGEARCSDAPDPARFRPHGISAAELATGELALAVVAHGEREAVELFALTGNGAAAKLAWRGCVPMPPNTSGNDVELAADGSFAVANYMPTQQGASGIWYQIAGGLGLDTGDLRVWTPASGFRTWPGSASPTPNGVTRARDGERVFAAQTGSGRVVAIDAAGRAKSVEIGGHPDNLAWSPQGELLVASHASGFAFLRCAAASGPCRSPWTLHAIDPETLRARELLRHDGEAVGGVASAAQIGSRIYFGAVFGDRIGVVELE